MIAAPIQSPLTRSMNPLDRRPGLLRLVMGITDAVYRAAPPDPGSAVEACTGAPLSLAQGLPDQEAEPPAVLALAVSRQAVC